MSAAHFQNIDCACFSRDGDDGILKMIHVHCAVEHERRDHKMSDDDQDRGDGHDEDEDRPGRDNKTTLAAMPQTMP